MFSVSFMFDLTVDAGGPLSLGDIEVRNRRGFHVTSHTSLEH